ncbi:MAG: PAS domain S-box protein [bacterium]
MSVDSSRTREQLIEELATLRKRLTELEAKQPDRNSPPGMLISDDQQDVESALRREKAFTDSALDAQSDIFFVFDPATGTAIRWNKAVRDISGYSDDEIAAMKIPDDWCDEADQDRAASAFETVFREGQATVELTFITKAGQRIPFEQQASIVPGELSGSPYIITVGRDITERKLAEEQSKIFKMHMEQSGLGFGWAALNGDILRINPALCRMLGEKTLQDAVGKNVALYYRRDLRKELEEVILPTVLQTGQWIGELSLVAIDGKETPAIQNIFLIRNDLGEPLYFANVITDITERKRAEQERRSLEAQMLHAQKLESLGVLAGGIAHDFNNLLMAIMGNTDLALCDMEPDSSLRPLLAEVLEATRQGAELANQMLAYSGKGAIHKQLLDLNSLVSNLANLLETSISKKVTLEYDLASGLPAIEGDPTQLRQVVMNLIVNGSEALREDAGSLFISTGVVDCGPGDLGSRYLTDDLPPGDYVYLEVTDTGCGMDEETLEKLFDPFFTTKFTGRGLGLSATLGIIKGHNGSIVVESEPGKGTTFRILMPANSDSVNSAPVIENTTAIRWRGQGTALVVDDMESVRRQAALMLERLGFRVLEAANGEEAMEIFQLQADRITFVLLDMTMPVMDGAETLRELRKIREDVCVVLSSGYAMQAAVDRFGEETPAGFIQKPFRLVTLAAKLRDVLEPADR